MGIIKFIIKNKNMELTTMHSRVKRLTWASTYTFDDFLEDINDVKNKFWSKYVSSTEDDRHYQEWNTTSVDNQSEYTLAEVTTSTEWTKMLKSVAINYDGETYENTWLLKYIQAREVNRNTLQNEWNYYLENQSKEDPIYFIADNSFFISPVPRTTEWGVNRLKLTWICNIKDYTVSTTQAQMIIPVDYHYVLMLWVIPFALMTKRADNNEVIKAQNDYNNAETEAIFTLTNRKEWPITMGYPNYNLNSRLWKD